MRSTRFEARGLGGFIGFGDMDVTKPYEFIGFGAMEATNPYESAEAPGLEACRSHFQ